MTESPSTSTRSSPLNRNRHTPRILNSLVLQSPQKCCAICLELIKDECRCYAYACFHQFCLDCLIKWCDQKPECPLCKRKLRNIIHNVKSERDYLSLEVGNVSSREHSEHISEAIYELFRDETTQIQLFELMYSGDTIPSRQENEGIPWRNYVYKRHLFANPSTIEYTFDLNSTADYYRRNDELFECLCKWSEREIHAISQNNAEMNETSVWTTLKTFLQNHDLSSLAFEQLIAELIGQFIDAKHFLHELRSFARSPYNFDVVTYDEMVAYDPHLPRVFPLSPFSFDSPVTISPAINRYYNRRHTPDYFSTPTTTRSFQYAPPILQSRRLFDRNSTPQSGPSFDFNSTSPNLNGSNFSTPENEIRNDVNFGGRTALGSSFSSPSPSWSGFFNDINAYSLLASPALSPAPINQWSMENKTPIFDPFTFNSDSTTFHSSESSPASLSPRTAHSEINNIGQHSSKTGTKAYDVSGVTPLKP